MMGKNRGNCVRNPPLLRSRSYPLPALLVLLSVRSFPVQELHCTDTPCRHALMPSLGLAVLAARACGTRVLDGVHLDLADPGGEGFAAVCAQGREMGFDGKTLIHPKTVGMANAAFAPSTVELKRAHAVIDAHAAAVARGDGVVVLDGRLVENLHVEDAARVVALGALCEAADTEK